MIRKLAAFLMVLLLPVSLTAQAVTAAPAKNHRDGFYIGFGFGAGQLGYGGDASSADAQGGLSGHFRLGGTLNQQWRIGAETNGFLKNESGVDLTYSALLGTATFYPSPTGNFFLKGGLGVAGYSEDYGTDEITAAGGAWTLGLGYDFRFSGKTGISIVGNYVGAGNWGIELNGEDTGFNSGVSLVQVGVGVIWH